MGLFFMLKRGSRLALKGNLPRTAALLLILLGVSAIIAILRQAALYILAPTAHVIAQMEPSPVPQTLEAIARGFSLPTAEWIIMAVSWLLTMLLAAPFSLGVTRWFFRLSGGERPSVSEAFHFFEDSGSYCRAIWLDVNLGIRCGLWAIPFYAVPGGVLVASILFFGGADGVAGRDSALAGAGIFLSAVLFLLVTFFYAACICRYALTPYLLSEDDEITVRQAIKTSVKQMRGFKFSFMCFGLSYAGWFLLLPLVFPVFYVWPYYSAGLAMYARFIIEKAQRTEPDPDFTREFPAPPEPA